MMRTFPLKTAGGLAGFILLFLCLERCRGQGSVPGPSQQNISSNTQGSQAMPLATGGVRGGLPCDGTGASNSAGGYQPVTDKDEVSNIQNNLAPLAFQEYVSTHNVSGCMAKTAKAVSYNITKACKQVVAGTNYAFAFSTSYDCTTLSNEAATGSAMLNSIIYEPLPIGGQNARPQVTKVWNAATS